MGRIFVRTTLVALLLVPVAGPAAAETPYPQLYFRDIADAKGVLGIVRNLALRRRPDSVLVVFDAATFAPPPGMNEFNFTHVFKSDIPGWLEALDALKPPANIGFHAATTLSGRPLAVGEPGWRGGLEAALRLPWWLRKDLRGFPSAPAWIGRLLAKVPGPRRMLVLVTGDALPERWADRSVASHALDPWRRKLLKPGQYWNEEAVAAAVRRQGATLDIVAPEARFGDFLPRTDIPELPWASRPTIPIFQPAPSVGTPSESAKPTLEQLVEALRKTLPDASEEELREMAQRIIDGWGAPPPEGWEPPEPAYRFNSLTPLFCPHYGSFTFTNTDCPSRYGYWPFARAAAATGGSLLFYPFKPVDFLDRCPYDPTLLRMLAPEYGTRQQFAAARGGDPALHALCRASRTVSGVTPWRDGYSWSGGGGRAMGWLGFASATPLVLEKRYRERNKPFEWLELGTTTAKQWKAYGLRLKRILPLYDKAIGILDDAAKDIAAGKGARPHRRSMANLRLARFWFEMSAFHLEAFSLYVTEFEKHAPAEVALGNAKFGVTYIETIRMSDCLAGYEGVTISEEEDEILQDGAVVIPGVADWWTKSQSNVLRLGYRDPRYRALRHPRQVMKRLDPRLKSRAIRMIDAGGEVMRNEGRSPWGWMVYYSHAFTFIYYPVPPGVRPRERPGVDPPDGTPTPRPKPRARGPGSGSGG